MIPIPVPENIRAGRAYCQLVNMGPPLGVSDEDCGTAQMLVGPSNHDIPGYEGRANHAYYRPSKAEIETLADGGVIEFTQYGQVVQPFAARIWPPPAIHAVADSSYIRDLGGPPA